MSRKKDNTSKNYSDLWGRRCNHVYKKDEKKTTKCHRFADCNFECGLHRKTNKESEIAKEMRDAHSRALNKFKLKPEHEIEMYIDASERNGWSFQVKNDWNKFYIIFNPTTDEFYVLKIDPSHDIHKFYRITNYYKRRKWLIFESEGVINSDKLEDPDIYM